MPNERTEDDDVDAAIRRRVADLSDGRLRRELLASGQTVVYLQGDAIVQERPDGQCEVIGHLDDDHA